MSRIVSFRGLLASGAQKRIALETIRGEKGYRIVKFEMFSYTPGIGTAAEHLIKIYKVEQTAVDGTVNFSDNTLLGSGFLPVKTSEFTQNDIVVFDNEIFNQNIYVTHSDIGGNSVPCNFYIELEQRDLALDEATVATLKDIRNND